MLECIVWLNCVMVASTVMLLRGIMLLAGWSGHSEILLLTRAYLLVGVMVMAVAIAVTRVLGA